MRPCTRPSGCCRHRSKTDNNSCNCPKWLYVNREGEPPRRYSLVTPSWTEALEEAPTVLKGFDPALTEARQQREKQKQEVYAPLEAINLWMELRVPLRPKTQQQQFPG